MYTKKCTKCNIENFINNFYRKYSECRECIRVRGLKRYYENKEKISNQQKIYYEKNNRCIQTRDLVISYVDMQIKLKALEEKIKINDLEIH